MIFYLIIAIVVGCAFAYFGVRDDWFKDRVFNLGVDPFKVLGVILGTIFWPVLIVLAPIIASVWLAKKHKR